MEYITEADIVRQLPGIADDLESGAIPPEAFNMSTYTSCGTTYCILGHAVKRLLPEISSVHLSNICHNLHIEDYGLNELFYTYHDNVTTKEAAKAIRTYLQTGIPEYDRT